MREYEVVVRSECGKAFLRHIEVGHPDSGKARPGGRGDKRTENREAGTVECRDRDSSRRVALKTRHRLAGTFEGYFDADRGLRERASGIRERHPATVFEGQRSRGVALQGADLLGD